MLPTPYDHLLPDELVNLCESERAKSPLIEALCATIELYQEKYEQHQSLHIACKTPLKRQWYPNW